MEIEKIYQAYLENAKVSTDTRNITKGSLFFALKGPNFNANTMAASALEKGASFVVVDELHDEPALAGRYFLVEDALQALQALANHHRRQLDIPIIGITGSNGKTTTKELTHTVLAQKYKVFATFGNLNNHIGVPLSLLDIGADIEVAIIEMGANKVGDIAELCAIAEPTHGLITNIGMAHVGYFGGFDNIVRGKSELYQHLIDTNGTVWINSQNDILANMAKRFAKPHFYPSMGDDFECTLLEASPFVKYQDEEGLTVVTQLVGAYNFENIAAALCIGKHFGVPAGQGNQAVAAYIPDNNRSQIVKKGSNTIILDAYNANPSSMESAIENIAIMEGKHKVLVLGDMYELGDESDAAHAKLGTLAKEKGFTAVYFCGKLIQPAMHTFPDALYFEEKEALAQHLEANKPEEAIILLKASRAIGLESLVSLF